MWSRGSRSRRNTDLKIITVGREGQAHCSFIYSLSSCGLWYAGIALYWEFHVSQRTWSLPSSSLSPSRQHSACRLSCFSLVFDSLQPYGLQPARLSSWDSPGKNPGVHCHFLLQGIFPTQGSNSRLLRLLHCRWILDR